MTLATMGVAYTLAMMGSALAIKKPHPTYKITGSTSATPTQSLQNVHTDDMFKMPQFIALGSALVVTASGVCVCVSSDLIVLVKFISFKNVDLFH